MNWLVTVAIKAVLEWLTSLLVRLKEKEQQKEEGRQEVLKDIDRVNDNAEKALHDLGKARATLTDDDFARELRDGYNASKKPNSLPGR